MEIYKDNHHISRSIMVHIADDGLTLDSYDSSKGFSYERIITVTAVDELRKAMNVSTDQELLMQIKKDYAVSDAIDLFGDYLTENNIVYQYHSFSD